jgi:hypothetical protein
LERRAVRAEHALVFNVNTFAVVEGLIDPAFLDGVGIAVWARVMNQRVDVLAQEFVL